LLKESTQSYWATSLVNGSSSKSTRAFGNKNLSRSGLLAGKQYAAGLLSAGPDVAEAAQNYLFHMLAKYHQSPPKSGPLAGGTLLKAGPVGW
jgi:hypothetical protein